jgi:hypothetical protein
MYEACTDRLASFKVSRPQNNLEPLENLITGVLFLCAPFTYVARLEAPWADGVVSLDGWQKLLTSLLVEWSDSNLLVSTIFQYGTRSNLTTVSGYRHAFVRWFYQHTYYLF